MQTLQKITTEFVEMRTLKLTAVSGEGEIVVLWLTRLLGKLVDHCTKWLTRVMPDLAKSGIAKESRDQIQTFVQQSAQEIAEEVAVVNMLNPKRI